MNDYLESTIKQFQYYKQLGDKTIQQLEKKEHLYWQANQESNSIAIIIKHLHGNMMSRWTDFLNSDGEKKWRERAKEFEDPPLKYEEVTALWEEGWGTLLNALNNLKKKDLSKIIYIRNQGMTVVSAINRQLAHYAYHVGQIVFLGKQQLGQKWSSLSIKKGASIAYNQQKFSQSKNIVHYTDEWIDNKS